MRTISALPYLVTLIIVLAASACDDSGGPIGAGDPTRVTVLLTDAPGDVMHAWIDIGEVYLQGGDGEKEDSGGEGYAVRRAERPSRPDGIDR